MTAGGGLPKAGVRLVVEQLQKFVSDIGKATKSILGFKKATKDTADASTKDMKRMAAGTGDALKDNLAGFLKIRKQIDGLGGEVKELGGGLLQLKVPADATTASFQGMAEGLEGLGYSVEVVGGKVEKSTSAWGNFQKSMLRIGALRGGLAFRSLAALGGLGTALAVGSFVAARAGKAIAKTVNEIVDSVGEFEKTAGAERAFRNLSREAGLSMGSIVKDVEKASGFTIDKYDILTRKNKLLQAGFGDLARAMPQLAETARVMGNAFGEDAAGMLDNLIEAIRDADAATLESEYGFRGVTRALLEAAKDGDTFVDAMEDIDKAAVVLNTVLPQTEEVIRRLGGAASSEAANLRNFFGTIGDILKMRRDIAALDLYFATGGTGESLRGTEDVLDATLTATLMMEQMKTALDAGTVSQEEFNEAQREFLRITGKLGAIQRGSLLAAPAPTLEGLQDWIQEAEKLISGPVSMVPTYMGQDLAQNFQEQMTKVSELVSDFEIEWAVDFAKVMPLDEAKAHSEQLGGVLYERLEDAIRKTGSIASIEAQVVINEVLALVGMLFDYADERAAGVGESMRGAWVDFFAKTEQLVAAQEGDAERVALRLTRFLPFEDIKAFAEVTEQLLEDWAKTWAHDPDSLAAQYARANILGDAEDIAAAIQKGNSATKASTSSMKQLASATLLANQNLGDWAEAFKIEHGGRDPLQVYARHEQPLVAAMVDKLWGEDFAAKEGRPPNDAEWRAHWYEQWAPLEAWKGGPIGEATGPQAERAKAILKALGIEDLGDIYKKDWDKRKGLIDEMGIELTKIEELNLALGNLAAYIDSIAKPTKPPDDDNGEAETIGKEVGKAIGKTIGGVQEFQGGGITATGGLAMLHANEAILPLGDPSRAAAIFAQVLNRGFRMPGSGGGGVNINVPVTIHGPATQAMGQQIGNTVVSTIRSHGTDLRRAARRLGQ